MCDIQQELKERIAQFDEMVQKYLPKEEGFQKTVISAMKYSLMAGGKRMRPLLMAGTYEFFKGDQKEVLEAFMAAIEMIHTYSLIHDDLPAMDNDDYRRGKLTSHKVYGEAMAILAGDALLNYAYEVATKAVNDAFGAVFEQGEGLDAHTASRMMRSVQALKILGEMPGVGGMLGGQVVDVQLTGLPIPEKTLGFIYDYKTGALIEASMMIGACLAGASQDQINLAGKAAHDIGMAFQIQDDILDVVGTQEELGKPIHSDERNLKTTWVTLYGLDKAKEEADAYIQSAIRVISSMYVNGEDYAKSSFLVRFIQWLTDRKY